MKPQRIARTAALALALGALVTTSAVARPLPAGPDEPAQDMRLPDTRDYAQGRGTFNSPDVLVVKVREQPAPAAADGIDWGDAGIGAGTLLGLSLVGAGGALFVVQRRHAHVRAGT